jgi:transcriptional regulator with XRE-family HTH domain
MERTMATTEQTPPRLLTDAELAVAVRFLRENRRWSQEQLADLSGLSVRTIQRVEMNREADERFAALVDYMREYRDCADCYSEVQKFDIYADLQQYIDDLNTRGVAALCGAQGKAGFQRRDRNETVRRERSLRCCFSSLQGAR